MVFTLHEREQFKYLLPVQSDYNTIETVTGIIDKLKLNETENKDMEIDLTEKEITLLRFCISCLDKEKKIYLNSFSLVKKLLRS